MECPDDEEVINDNSHLGRLIVHTNGLLHRPVIDNSLCEILDSLLKNARDSFSDFHTSGIIRFSFPEAALLIQACANLYSKRVDLLWTTINDCQKRMISFESEENKIERQRLEERERKYKRKRKIVELPDNHEKEQRKSVHTSSFNVDWNEMTNLNNLGFERDPRLFSDWYKKMEVNSELQSIHKGNRLHVEKYCHFRSANDVIRDKDQDDEFVVHTSKMESVIALDELFVSNSNIQNEFSFELLVELQVKQRFLAQNQIAHEDLEKHAVEFEKFVSSYKDAYLYDLNSTNNRMKRSQSELERKMRRISVTSNAISKLNQSDVNRIFSQSCQVNVPRLSLDQLSRLSRLSIDEVKEFSRMCCNKDNFQDAHDDTCENNGRTLDQQQKFDKDSFSDPTTDCIEIDCENDEKIITTDETEGELNPDSSEEKKVLDSSMQEVDNGSDSTSNVHNSSGDILIRSENNDKNTGQDPREEVVEAKQRGTDLVLDKDDNEVPRKRRKMSKAALKKLAEGITADLRKFNVFYAAHYQATEGEGVVEVPEFEIGDPLGNSSLIDDELDDDVPLSELFFRGWDIQDSGIFTQSIFTNSHLTQTSIESTQEKANIQDFHDADNVEDNRDDDTMCLEDSGIDPSDNTLDLAANGNEKVQSSNAEPEIEKDEIHPSEIASTSEEKPLYQRVYEWKQHMTEIFKRNGSSDFDIHEYGSNIMNNLDMGKPKKFGEIVRGKSSAEVSRFFMSALQLANTENIEIMGAQDGKLANDTFSLNLITKDKYYDRLNDYMAPSEEYQQNVKKLKKKRDCSANQSSFKRHKNGH